ncbi:MAG: alcohol dehydrogenase catalytic domain-containing protein [Armatimonadetes bacterium]|nr:alcohol dehydrogenase catalytic domain-containing protein [Armatimonadota bacterium]
MKLARYRGGGVIAIEDEPIPPCPPGGLLVKALASGLCSGELMEWYMDQKAPHVLGHEVCGEIVESGDQRFPIGSRVFPHHHAPCLRCAECSRGAYVHCSQWKRTNLVPGGMAEYFAVAAENLNDALIIPDGMDSRDAALIEPLACVMKSLRKVQIQESDTVGVIGLGVMGLMHMAMLREQAVGFDLSVSRREWASTQGFKTGSLAETQSFDVVVVCPGSPAALELALQWVKSEGKVMLFAPMPAESTQELDLNALYFRDIAILNSYSCGPNDTKVAFEALATGKLSASEVVSDFITLDELPEAYLRMKRGEILKPMVLF